MFGGKLNLLGRATDIGSYVRHGADNAEIEAFVYDPELPGGIRRIKRQFSRQGTSTYFIDGKKVKMNEVEAEKKSYDIQLDNLSQFMPQEKIAEFVNHDAEQLLSCTIRALGGTVKLDEYDELVMTDANFAQDGGKLEQKKKALADNEAKASALETEVKAFEAHKAAKAEIELIERYLPWAAYAGEQTVYEECKSDVETYKVTVTAKENEVAQLQGPLTLIQQRHRASRKAFNEGEKANIKKKDKKTKDLMGAFDDVQVAIEEERNKLGDIDKEMERNARKIKTEEGKMGDHQKKLDAALRSGNDAEDEAIISQVREKKRALTAEFQETGARHTEVKHEIGDIDRNLHRLSQKDRQLGDVRSNRIGMLERMNHFSRIRILADFVTENRDKFRMHVHGPVACEIGCDNEYYARITNASVPPWFLGAFIVECHADGDVLRAFAESQRMKVNISTPPLDDNREWDRSRVPYSERSVDQRLQALGITSVVSDIFTAPDAVKAAINAQFRLQQVFVGNLEAERYMDDLVHERGVSKWYTPRQSYFCKTSKYNRDSRSTQVDALSDNQGLFAGRMDGVERERSSIAAESQGLTEKRTQLVAENDNLSEELQGVRSRTIEIEKDSASAKERVRDRARLKQNIALVERRIATLRSSQSKSTMEAKKKRCVSKLKDEEGQIVALSEAVTAALESSAQALSKMDDAVADFSAVDRELRVEQAKHADSNSELAEMLAVLKDLKERRKESQKELRKLKENAEASLPLKEVHAPNDSGQDLPARYGTKLVDVESVLRDKQELASRMTTGGHQVVKDYERLKDKINLLSETVRSMQTDQDSLRADFEGRKKSFLEWLSSRIRRMAKRFSELYKGMGCRGDIELVNEEAERMSDLAIHIMVSYRDDVDLRKVDPHSNSGGEKMCATMYVVPHPLLLSSYFVAFGVRYFCVAC